jgi:hypothetical protein
LKHAYTHFSVSPREQPSHSEEQSKESENHFGHALHFVEDTTAEMLTKAHGEVELGHHAGAVIMLVGAALLAYPAGAVFRYAVEAPSCEEPADRNCPSNLSLSEKVNCIYGR